MTIAAAALLLFLILDPLGNIPILLSLFKDLPAARQRKVLLRELLIALVVLMLFLWGGQYALELMHLRQESVSIAGGIVLFLIGIRMIFPPPEGLMGDIPGGEPFIVPMAIPLVAGPSILATLMLLSHQYPNQMSHLTLALFIAWGLSMAILLLSNLFLRLLGDKGVSALERLMGLILVMLSTQMFLDGIRAYLKI